MIFTSPATETIAVIRIWPRPVIVTTPAIMPAMPHATATERVLLPPLSNASTKPDGVIRVSLLIMLTAIATSVAMTAARDMVKPFITIPMRIISGSSRYPFWRNSLPNFGSVSLSKPFSPSFFASRWTIIKIPAK